MRRTASARSWCHLYPGQPPSRVSGSSEMRGMAGARARPGALRLPAAHHFKTAKNPPGRQTHPSPDQPLHPSRSSKTRKKPAIPARPLGPPPAATTRQRNAPGPRGLSARPLRRRPANSADDYRRALRRPAAVFVLSATPLSQISERSARGMFEKISRSARPAFLEGAGRPEAGASRPRTGASRSGSAASTTAGSGPSAAPGGPTESGFQRSLPPEIRRASSVKPRSGGWQGAGCGRFSPGAGS